MGKVDRGIRRWAGLSVGLVAMAMCLLLAACGSSSSGGSATSAAAATSAAGTGSATTGATSSSAATSSSGGNASTQGVRVGLVLPDVSNPFIAAEQLGAVNEAKKYGIDLLVKGSNDGEAQVNAFDTYLSSGAKFLGINTIDGKAMGGAVSSANSRGVPVIGMQSPPASGKLVTFIASSNINAGVTVGNGIVKYCASHNPCLIGDVQGELTDPSGVDEEKGMKSVIAKHPNIKIVSAAPTNYDPEQAVNVAESMLTAHPNINWLFAWWDQGAQSAYAAVKAKGLVGKVGVSGFSGSCPALQDVLAGHIYYDAMEFPLLQGQTFIDDVHKYLSGDKNIPAQTVIPAFGINPALAQSILAGKTKAPIYVLQALQQAKAGCPGL
jgi:ABC-type sugar transport system substrate-binding protein